MRRSITFVATLIIGTLCAPASLRAQYFGQNKVQYQSFDFEVLETEHFDIYYYEAEAETIPVVAKMAERWYDRLSRVLGHELRGRQPLILYASHSDFRQTNAIPGEIGESTGGVTEAIKRRIVLPMAGPLGDTDHVLGHELVHAFQYDITAQDRSPIGDAFPGALRLPLWFMEGMAEYLSIGARDPHTAMWIRDSMLYDHIPSISDLSDPRYFPYRYGQAFWAYVAGRWGDAAIGDMLRSAGRSGTPQSAIREVLDIDPETLSEDWADAIRSQYRDALDRTAAPEDFGHALIAEDAGGDVQVSPAISPDGRRVVFFSERDLFSIDMFLADVGTGRILGKITDSAVDPHLENLQFIQSSGTWSPDGDRFAYGAIVQGRPHLKIVDIDTLDEVRDVALGELDEVLNPTWSPDGSRIAFSAMTGGLTDLFAVGLDDGTLQRLTSDSFSELHPAWSPDGSRIAFVTDRFTSDPERLSFGDHRLALLSLDDGSVREIPVPGGKAINPQWSSDGGTLYYLADDIGVANLHAIDPDGGGHRMLTSLQTGVSGITALSPALSVSAGGDIVYTVYGDGRYVLNVLDGETIASAPALAMDPGRLPTPDQQDTAVEAYLRDPSRGLQADAARGVREYRPSLSLDYVATPSVSVGASSFGVFAGGGTALYWSDMLGNHNLVTGFELSTDGAHLLRDLSGMVGYENRKHRWNWGFLGGQAPLRSVGFATGFDVVDGETVVVERELRYWQIQREILGTLSYPLNRAQRIEFASGFQNISFATDVKTRVYDPFTGRRISSTDDELPTPDALRMAVANAALVYDQTVQGPISPFRGQRYRLEVSGRTGGLDFATGLIDYRRYFMPFRPFVLAGRLLHYGRYGGGAEDPRIQELFLGDTNLVRGYEVGSFSAAECGVAGGCPVVERLLGSRIAVANLEARLPLLGPLGVLSTAGVPVEAAVFFDAGSAWSSGHRPDWLGGDRPGVSSHGASLRIGMGGIATFQFSLVHPNDRPLKGWDWEFAIAQGF